MSAKILIVDDETNVRLNYRITLETEGYEIFEAASGEKALEALAERSFHLAVLDMRLPGMDGLTIIETLRDEGIRAPVLVLSALGAVDERVRGLRSGGDDYLTKPFATVELVARIEALLRRPASVA